MFYYIFMLMRRLINSLCSISYLLIIAFNFSIFQTFAEQNIQIVGGNTLSIPKVAVISFANKNNTAINVADIITQDLNTTGEFNATTYPNASDVSVSMLNLTPINNPQYTISGTVTDNTITYRLIRNITSIDPKLTPSNKDASLNKPLPPTLLINQQLTFNSTKDIRRAAHIASNTIYEKLTNTKGIFTSKIAYISRNKKQHKLIIADYDGYNQRAIITSNYPLISLSFSPNDRQIAYTSFESGKPVVYVQDIYAPNRYMVANFNGSNSSPTFTPDGSKLAVVLSKDYGSHIYLINNAPFSTATQASSLIKFGTIDTEANFNNNSQIVFTSNHDGGPQIFIINPFTGEIKRLSINLGSYNTTPRFAHNTNKITFINRNGGVLKAYIMDLNSTPAISYPINMETIADISPSFSPNDKLILFSSNNSMYIVNATGTVKTKLININEEQIIDQSWANNF